MEAEKVIEAVEQVTGFKSTRHSESLRGNFAVGIENDKTWLAIIYLDHDMLEDLSTFDALVAHLVKHRVKELINWHINGAWVGVVSDGAFQTDANYCA